MTDKPKYQLYENKIQVMKATDPKGRDYRPIAQSFLEQKNMNRNLKILIAVIVIDMVFRLGYYVHYYKMWNGIWQLILRFIGG